MKSKLGLTAFGAFAGLGVAVSTFLTLQDGWFAKVAGYVGLMLSYWLAFRYGGAIAARRQSKE